MASSTLSAIQTKVRRLTRSPSAAQITDNEIIEYVNTFIQYDFPEHLRLFNLHSTFSFYTEPFVDVYESSDDVNSPLYQFKQKYLTINPPMYIAGYQAFYTQSEQEFFNLYPKLNSITSNSLAGNGAQTTFNGVINLAGGTSSGIATQQVIIVRNQVLFSSVDINGNGLALIDYPISATIGNLYVPGTAPTSTTAQDPNNYINYTTGAFTVSFGAAPATGVPINSQVQFQAPNRPLAIMFYDSKFTLRPIPDQPYKVTMEVYYRPSELLLGNQMPELQEWWQYIAYGAAKKIFEDRMDLDSVSLIMPEFKKQEALINRRTIVQNTTQRTQTIYTEQTAIGAAPNGFGWGGGYY